MSAVAAVARAVWDFVVGDDWRVALGVVLALAVTALVATSTVALTINTPPPSRLQVRVSLV